MTKEKLLELARKHDVQGINQSNNKAEIEQALSDAGVVFEKSAETEEELEVTATVPEVNVEPIVEETVVEEEVDEAKTAEDTLEEGVQEEEKVIVLYTGKSTYMAGTDKFTIAKPFKVMTASRAARLDKRNFRLATRSEVKEFYGEA